MAEKLSIQIALDGGAEIERQLEGIGAAGQKAFADIVKSAEQAGGFKQIKPEEVTAKLKDMGVTGVDAIDKIQKAVASAGRLEGLVAGITSAENAFAALGRAAIPVGAALVAAMAAATQATISFADSITRASEQAMKLGQSIEQFDRMRRALEGAGVSTQNVTGFMQRLGAAAEKADLDKVARATKEIQAAMARGAGPGAIAGTAEWQNLVTLATQATEAGKRAREALDAVGAPIPPGAALTLGELVAKTGSAEAGLKAFVEQLRGMPNQVQANKAAMDALGVSATQLITAYDGLAAKGTGAITPDMVTKAGEVTAAVNEMKAAWDRLGTVSFAPVVVAELNTITAALQALQDLINNFSWNTFTSAATSAGEALKWLTPGGLVSLGIEALNNKAKELGSTLAQTGQQAAQAGQTAESGWDGFLRKLDEIARKAGTILGGGGGGGGSNVPAKARGGLLGGRGTGTSDSNLAWLSRGEYIMPARAVRQPGVLSFLEALRRSGRIPGFAEGGSVGGTQEQISVTFSQIMEQLSNGINPIIDEILRIADANVQSIDQVAKSLDGIIDTLTANAKQVADGLTSVAQSLSGVLRNMQSTLEQKAGGGLLGGRGSGTSDSNLAWVSRGEHIMPARAVAQPGVLAFLEALRRSGGNLSQVLNGMGRFALGGVVPAAGGGGSNVTIQFPGLPAIGGLRASADVVDQLHRAAAMAQVRSGGRKPSRYS